MKLYLDNDYVNASELLDSPYPFIFGTGARGIGKTYGVLSQLVLRMDGSGRRFIYLRRTNSQIELLLKPEFNPYKSINADMDLDIIPAKISKNSSGFYHSTTNEDGEIIPVGDPLGYIFALSTFFNMRSVDFSDVDVIFYDEFIPEGIERKLQGEGEAFLNLIETVGRNRELKGLPPLKVICMSNSNKLENALYMELHLVNKAVKMQEQGLELMELKDRGILLVMFSESKISQKKKDTSLYVMTKDSDFYGMAVENQFTKDDQSLVKKRINLNEYRPIVKITDKIGDMTILKHKSDVRYYVTMLPAGACKHIYSKKEHDLDSFYAKYLYLWVQYKEKLHVYFDSYETELLFRGLFTK